jgi:flavin reductase (DIM6/NTAB) family NADH-FMN oxidoreductase RutF
MDNVHLSEHDINTMDKRKRVNFVNSLSGFKSANLIGTVDKNGNDNLSIVSSVMHLGSSPCLLAFIVRPNVVARHTLHNILQTKKFTINAISEEFYKQAHQTSARYNRHTSEFDTTGLTPYYIKGVIPPFVLESPVKVALSLIECVSIKANNTKMIIGQIETVLMPKSAIRSDGYINIESLGLMTISGLDNYHITQSLGRLSYAKPKHHITSLDLDGKPFVNNED